MQVTFLTDFSDRISPMLVKELRQGLRAKTFIAVFLSLQIFLAVMLFSAGAASSSDHVGSVISGIIFTFFSMAVLVVQPLRGTGVLSSEVKGNTIDMMVLTRLSAWRIVFGKWVAIVGQTALLFATIIPYLILRYFFGGMDLLAEMTGLLLVFLTSMALTAITVGLSGCSSVIVRSLVPMLGLPVLLWTFLVGFIFRGFGGSRGITSMFSLDSAEAWIGLASYVLTIVYLGASVLSLGASLIAPAAENHSFPRRAVALFLLLCLIPLGFVDRISDEIIVTLAAVIAIPAIIIALTDSSQLVPTVCKPFVKRGMPGHITGWLFYPTWESGILFSIVLGLTALAIIFGQALGAGGSSWATGESIAIVAIFGSLFFPAAWQVFLFRGDGQRVGHYLLLLVGSFIMLGILTALSDSMNSSIFLWFFAWNPLAFIAMLEESKVDKEVLLTACAVVDIALLSILTFSALIGIRKSSAVIEEACTPPDTAA